MSLQLANQAGGPTKPLGAQQSAQQLPKGKIVLCLTLVKSVNLVLIHFRTFKKSCNIFNQEESNIIEVPFGISYSKE